MSEDNLRLYSRFIRFSLGLCQWDGSDINWRDFYNFCKKQTLVGVAFDGISRLPKGSVADKALLLEWYARSEMIRRMNIRLDRASADIYHRITSAGYRCCILKGQGNAMMYPNRYARTPGDVDVWVVASRDEINTLALRLAGCNGRVGEESLNHVELMVDGVSVELHSTPIIVSDFVRNRRIQRWVAANADRQCVNVVDLDADSGSNDASEGGVGKRLCISVPTADFNVIYQLMHLYHHYFYEGVGLRQIVDFYMLLHKADVSAPCGDGAVMSGDAKLERMLRSFGLYGFAGAVMYVLHVVMGLGSSRMIVPMDEIRGKMLMDDILRGGNFGHGAPTAAKGHGAMEHNLGRLRRDLRLLLYYPAEAFCEPLFRVWHFLWRMF